MQTEENQNFYQKATNIFSMFITDSESQTRLLAFRLSAYLKPQDIVILTGNLGSGKTTFVKGLAEGLGFNPNKVTSSSFVLCQTYKAKKMNINHLDLYRLKSIEDIIHLGYEEILFGDNLTVIEWPQLINRFLGREYLKVDFKIIDNKKRGIKLSSKGKRFLKTIAKLKNEYISH